MMQTKEEANKKSRDWYAINGKRPSRVMSGIKANAIARKYSFELTLEEFMTFWKKPCAYCGSDVETAAIDRIDNLLGYSPTNCVSCCYRCNVIKNKYSVEETNQHLIRMLKHQGLI